jgi:hypothetical protein
MSQKLNSAIAVIGIDIGKNSFHLVGLDKRGAIVLRLKWSRGQVEARLANMQPCLIDEGRMQIGRRTVYGAISSKRCSVFAVSANRWHCSANSRY